LSIDGVTLNSKLSALLDLRSLPDEVCQAKPAEIPSMEAFRGVEKMSRAIGINSIEHLAEKTF